MKVLESMTMGVLVLAMASCASSAPPLQPPTVNVTGDWVGTWTCDYTGDGNGGHRVESHPERQPGDGSPARDQFDIQPGDHA